VNTEPNRYFSGLLKTNDSAHLREIPRASAGGKLTCAFFAFLLCLYTSFNQSGFWRFGD
jgi:F0F1-type ATP synthase membrane subunit a